MDPKSKSHMSTPKDRLADILTRGNFTRDEWNILLHLLSISHFTFFFLLLHSEFPALPAVHKRWRKGCNKRKEKKELCHLVSHAATSSSTLQSPIASKSPWTLRAPCQQDWKSTGKTCSERTESRRNVEFTSVAKRCRDGQEYEETRSVLKLRHRRYWQSLATQSPYIYCLRSTS